MKQATTTSRSSLGLIVLALLSEEPMHVYRMQKLIQQRGKDRVVNARARASLYQTIERLLRLGLVEVRATIRNAGYPDRIVYAITPAGRMAMEDWLRAMLHTTGGDFPEFIAAVSVLPALTPDDARRQLELRAEKLAAALAEIAAELGGHPGLPRLFLLEEEYRRTMLATELTWVRAVVDDLRAGRLTWDEPWQRAVAGAFNPPDESEDGGKSDWQ
jgi:DNA-binding PadR family transcriptional regulator